MNEKPPLLILSRQMLAHMGAAKVGLDTLAVASGSTAASSGLASQLAGTKIALILPMVASGISLLSLLLRALLSYYMGIAVLKNPINSKTTQVISQPEPLTPTQDDPDSHQTPA